MAAFRGAVEAGAHAVEADVRLTRDGVAVLSHDVTLTRCFGRPERLADLDWATCRRELRTLRQPTQPLPSLADLLAYLASEGPQRDVWLLLDVKLNVSPGDAVLRAVAASLASVPAAPGRPWPGRVLLGVWATSYLPLCAQHLPAYPVAYIGFSTAYAAHFLRAPGAGFNMLHGVLPGPVGSRFVTQARRRNRAVLAYTVNDEGRMRWCVRRGLDGVVTDDPAAYLRVCRGWEAERDKWDWTARTLVAVLRANVLCALLGMLFRLKFGVGMDSKRVAPAPVLAATANGNDKKVS